MQVEMGDKEWRKMKQQQRLVFGDAPSDVINKQQAMRENVEPKSTPKKHRVLSDNRKELLLHDSAKEKEQDMRKHPLPLSHNTKLPLQKDTK